MSAASVFPSTSPQGPRRPRVMIVDDSVVVRGLVARWLEASACFEVVASVANGRIALDALDRAQPDIALLDLDMPELDGISTLPRLLAQRPELKVVVISTLTQRNADISLRCLALGAVDYLPKPESNRQVTTSLDFRTELVAKLRALGAAPRRRAAGPAAVAGSAAHPTRVPAVTAAPPRPAAARARPSGAVPRCLLIGASTGGPRAVAALLSGLRPVLPRLPVLVVQHMPPIFTSVFADHLRGQLGLPAREPQDGERLRAGQIYVAPGGRHMGLMRDGGVPAIRLDDGPPVNFCRPAVDVLFWDAAAVLGASALAVVLTGMGSDGTRGARALDEAGGTVIVQDEATSTVWGMPGSIARAGLAQGGVLALEAIAPAVADLMGGGAA